MNRRDSKTKKLDKRLMIASVGLSATIILGLVVYQLFFQPKEIKFSLKAAIIDQLSLHSPNPTFKETAISLLEQANFTVSYFGSESTNVTFYKGLAKNDYGIIILRAHSALRASETTIDLFTSEPYSESKYLSDQSDGFLTKGNYSFDPTNFYFAITPKFIENLEGTFPKSVVIAMGCWSLKPECEEMAEAFTRKGATAYVGWNETVLNEDTDIEISKLLDWFLAKNETLANAIAITSPHNYIVNNVTVTSQMDFYPPYPSTGNLKIADLIAEANNSLTSSLLSVKQESYSFLITNTPVKIEEFR